MIAAASIVLAFTLIWAAMSLQRKKLKTWRAALCKPTIEWLESRLAPTTSTWTGAMGNQWSTVGNWSNGLPSSTVGAVFSSAHQVDCYGASGTIASLAYSGGYSGTLHLSGS